MNTKTADFYNAWTKDENKRCICIYYGNGKIDCKTVVVKLDVKEEEEETQRSVESKQRVEENEKKK